MLNRCKKTQKGPVPIMSNKIRDEKLEFLLRGILTLDSIDECYHFFEDVCTIKEIQDIAQRLKTARMLSEGANYLEINKETGCSTATISRVRRSLEYGSGGYRTVLARVPKKETNT